MQLDAKHCYRAMRSRDARFDGRFFIAVKTTGIYCRPICPARTPKRENVDFYPSAAAAEHNGFRACRRCRPDASPGTPEWLGTSGIVSRGLRMIHSGMLDQETLPRMSARLGVGERHLTRLFMEHLGTTPGAIARTRRVHFARKLIDQTQLPMTEVAAGAGFSSLRRFNAAIRETFRATPGELRGRASSDVDGDAPLDLLLAYRPPLDWPLLLDYFRYRSTPGVEEVAAEVYRRTIDVDGGPGVIEINPGDRENTLRLRAWLPSARALLQVVERVRDQFDLRADPGAIEAGLGGDRILGATLRRHPGLRVPGAWNGFELAVRAILGQQVSVKGATTIAGRVAERCGEPLPERLCRGSLTHRFPTAAALAAAQLDGIGMPGGRVRAVQELARAVERGDVVLEPFVDAEEMHRALVALPGIGEWTADYVCMRALRQPDAFPAADLGLQKGAAPDGERLSTRELSLLSENWRPWRSYAAIALWTRQSERTAKSTNRKR